MTQGNRRLFFWGFVFFALAPVTGFLIMAPVPNPRAMMSLHVACWLSGALVCAAAAAWPHLSLSPRAASLAQGGLVIGMWFGIALGLVQVFGNTPSMFAGGSPHPPSWATAALTALQLAITVTLVPALFVIATGLGKRARA